MTTGVIRTGNSTSLGTGTTRTEITPTSGLFMPDDAKVLLDIESAMASITPTAAQSITAKLELASSSIKNLTPFNALFPITGSGLGATYNTLTKRETWEVNAPLKGGEALHVWGTALVANTVAPEAQAWITVSNDMNDLRGPQYHAELGTITSTGTVADTDVFGTKYSLSGPRMITQLFGAVHTKVIAAGDMVIGEIKYVSSEFMDSYDQALPLNPMSFGLGATGSYLIPGISRKNVKIPIKPNANQVNIQDALNFGGVIASAGSFIDGVVYV